MGTNLGSANTFIMRPSYYAIIPAEVRYSSINPSAKLLFGEITALCNQKGYCWATNSYFSELYGVTKNTISSWINELKRCGFVSVEVIRNDKRQVVKRKIGIIENRDTPTTIYDEDNSIKLNTKKELLLSRKMKFEESIFQIKNVSKDVLKEFISYWTEPNKSGTKMRFELEKTWDTNRRLQRWCKNNLEWAGANRKQKTNKYPTNIENAHNEWLKARNAINNEL